MAEKVERRLAAILSADVVGYSRLMATDEAGTLARLKAHRRDLIDPKISEHNGRLVKLMGDGTLVEFASVVDAVECAVSIQQGMAARNETEPENQRIEFRIGINLGEIIVDGDDIYGDGVNIAARMEQLAKPGGVYLSGEAYRQARGRAEVEFEDIGEKQVKNIEQPVRVYAVTPKRTELGQVDTESEALPLLSKPSIAVLPFENMSGDPEQEYFSDGIAEDIITGLSRFRDLFVIARNSSFTYKGRTVDIKQVGRELGVRYVLEGGVRKAGNRVRITAQLIEAESGNHMWAEKYDGGLEDIFDLQDEITAKVVAAIGSTVFMSEIERASRKRPESLDAYEMCMRGYSHEVQLTLDSIHDARKCFLTAIDLDDRLGRAHTGLAGTYQWEIWLGGSQDIEQSRSDALAAAHRAVEIDETDAKAHEWVAWVLLFTGRVDAALAEIDRSIELSPNNSQAHCARGIAHAFAGRPEEGAEEIKLAMQLSPLDWLRFLFVHTLAVCHYNARDYTAAADMAMKLVALRPDYLYGHWHLAISSAQLGKTAQAQSALKQLLRLKPDFDREFIDSVSPWSDPADVEHAYEGLRKAGWEG